MRSEISNGHASILVSLPSNRCERVRDVMETLCVLEEVYNHLYAWCLLVSRAANNSDGFGHRAYAQLDLCSLAVVAQAVPEEDCLCLAQIEINPPAFVEIVGATKVLRVMQECLSDHGVARMEDGESRRRSPEGERGSFVRREVDLLCGLNFSEAQIQEALSKHVIAPLARLQRVRGIALYE